MASTDTGRRLTELHRRRQLVIRASAVSDLLAVWPAFTLADIDGSWPAVEAALLSIIAARRTDSERLSANYFTAFRMAEGETSTAQPRSAPPPSRALQAATLRILGPIATKKTLTAGTPNPAERALTRITGTVTRQVLQAGRDTLAESVRADPAARGWRRITSSSPCPFCAGIAAEGVIGVDVDFPAHDHCSCTQEPVYTP